MISQVAAMAPLPVAAQPGLSVYGGAGLLQTPVANSFDDGAALLQYQDTGPYRYWSATMQVFPWLETVIRYSDLRHLKYSDDPGFSGEQTLKDKGIDVKLNLWQESQWVPEIAAGLRDLGGTGLFASEYLVASKRWSAAGLSSQLQLHLGVGFGRLGSQQSVANPFCQLHTHFCQRANDRSVYGGDFSVGNYFAGPAAIFGGIQWLSPDRDWQWQLEYDSHDYQSEFAGPLLQSSRFNVGVQYQATEQLAIKLGWLRGEQLAMGFHYRFNLHKPAQVQFVPPAEIPSVQPVAGQHMALDPLLRRLAAETGFITSRVELGSAHILLHGQAQGYRGKSELVQRIGRILAAELPQHIRTYRLRFVEQQVVVQEIALDSARFIQAVRQETDVGIAINQQPDAAPAYHAALQVESPNWFYIWQPYVHQSFGQPERFYSWQLGASMGGGYRLTDGWQLVATARTAPFGNFRKMKFRSDPQRSNVPEVRTLTRNYADRDLWLDTAYTNWWQQVSANQFVSFYAGYLETMFAGAGAEWLYRPVEQDIAVGLDINRVRQRNFRTETGLFPYGVTTGHLSVYWQLPFAKDILVVSRFGRYLAGDNGMTLEVARRFDGGIVLGMHASKTTMSAREYGEGNFTKGLYLSIPFEYFTGKPGRGRGTLPWLPISRNGGQQLNRPQPLYDLTEFRSPFADR